MRVGDEFPGELDDGLDDVVRAAGRATSRRATMSPSSVSTAPMNDVAAREVDSDDAVAVPIEIDQDGGLAGAGCLAHALLGDEAVGDEVGDQVRDRDAREAGFAGEVCPHMAPWWKRV